jgi:hypothetical protein
MLGHHREHSWRPVSRGFAFLEGGPAGCTGPQASVLTCQGLSGDLTGKVLPATQFRNF